MENIWLSKNGQVQGPWTLRQVQTCIAEGTYALHDLAWVAPMPAWRPLAEVLTELEHTAPAASYSPPAPPVDTVAEGWQSQRVRPRPWRRYWARALDWCMVSILCATIFIPVVDVAFERLWYGAGLVSTLALCAYEVVCMRFFQTTFGKWVLGVYVRQQDGRPLTQEQSTWRALRVCLVGYAFGLPVLSFVAQCVAYTYLRRPEGAWWDQRGDLQVFYAPRLWLQQMVWVSAVALLVLVGLACLMVRQLFVNGVL